MATGKRGAAKRGAQRRLSKAGAKAGSKKAGARKRRPLASGRDVQRFATPRIRPEVEVASAVTTRRMILLPVNRSLRATASSSRAFLREMDGPAAAVAPATGVPGVRMKVLDSVHEDGAKLVEIEAEDIPKLRAAQPGLLVVPEVFFELAVRVHRVHKLAKIARAARTAGPRTTVTVLSRAGGGPVAGANVVAFTDFANRTGAGGTTDAQGVVRLALPAVRSLERLYVYPAHGYWGALQFKVRMAANLSVKLDPIDFSAPDSLRHFARAGAAGDGAGVKVAIIDTGVALGHPDLRVAGGACTVSGESPTDFGPLGGDHGTHCAGIVAAQGHPPTGARGVAPGAAIYSFRVFPRATPHDPEPKASNFAIAKAIDRAVASGCDILNLSLGGGSVDPATEAAIQDAREAGAIVIAAAGNDDRQPVSFPASYSLCVAVSALGRQGLFPAGSVDAGDVAPPPGRDPSNFIAAFSNVGPEIRCTGPGVGVVSTVPPTAYAVMSGTSMATPAVCGLAARLLSQNAGLLNAPRDANRADALVKLLLASAKDLGFAATLQGQGLPG